MNLDTLLSFFITSLVLTLSPGPDILYVLSQSISRGKQYGIASAIGLSTGLLFHTTLLAFGISSLITETPWMFMVLKCFGALYLIWLAYKVWKSPGGIRIEKNSDSGDVLQNVQQGLLMNIMNPKVMLFFLALFPGFIDTSLGNVKTQIYTLGSICMIQAFIVFIIVALASSRLSAYLLNNSKAHLFLKWMQIIVFLFLAVFLFL